APEELLKPLFHKYLVQQHLSNTALLKRLKSHYDPEVYGLGLTKLKELRKEWGFLTARAQKHNIRTIDAAIRDNAKRLSQQGRRGLKVSLRRDYGINVSDKPYESFGVFETWSFDQHDKWRRFYLYLHVGLDVFSGKILWLKIWWTNRNPRLVCGWYLDAIEENGGTCDTIQRSQSAHGLIANAQSYLRHEIDPELGETLQHRWRGKNRNIKPEILWSLLRRWWAPAFEAKLQEGLDVLYDPTLPLERYTFFYIFIPWLQFELDRYRMTVNDTKKQGKPDKVLPSDAPNMIVEFPEEYGVPVPAHLMQDARNKFAPEGHEVNQLVPTEFGRWADECYRRINKPEVTMDSCWDVYSQLLAAIKQWVEPSVRSGVILGAPLQHEEAELFLGEPVDVFDWPPIR
ncbi:hypothetical protein SISNIDRAFT_384265, partial [Sistotremastrum niveocremeum HHB9708]